MEKAKIHDWIRSIGGLFTIALGVVYLGVNPQNWPIWAIEIAWTIIATGILLLLSGHPWKWMISHWRRLRTLRVVSRIQGDRCDGTATMMKAAAFCTPPILRMMKEAWRLWPRKEEPVSDTFVDVIHDLENATSIIPSEWQTTGEPMPRDRRDIERLLARVGMNDVLASGQWTPSGISARLIGALEGRRESVGREDNVIPTWRMSGGYPLIAGRWRNVVGKPFLITIQQDSGQGGFIADIVGLHLEARMRGRITGDGHIIGTTYFLDENSNGKGEPTSRKAQLFT